MFTQKGAQNIPHLPPDSLFCLSMLGPDGAVGNKDQSPGTFCIPTLDPLFLSFPSLSCDPARAAAPAGWMQVQI